MFKWVNGDGDKHTIDTNGRVFQKGPEIGRTSNEYIPLKTSKDLFHVTLKI